MPKKQKEMVARLKVTKVGERFGYEAKAQGSTGKYQAHGKTYTRAWNAQSGAVKALKKQGYTKALLVNETGRKVLKEISL